MCESPVSQGSWGIYYTSPQFADSPPTRNHSKGTPLSFADGHSEYWKWRDKRSLEHYWGDPTSQVGNEDLYRLQRGVWGGLGYQP
jgi:prepilin-type processing-associated H-X9-DG protein